jgi:AcrR family transcriptional regulator
MAYLSAQTRRGRIIDAAIDVIAEEGLGRATTRRIADRADAPLGAMHYCFRNKDELMELVLKRGIATMRTAFDDIHPSSGLAPTIRDSVAAYWRWVRENIGLQLALMELLMWKIRREQRGSDLYARINNPFGAELLRANIRAAAAVDGLTLAATPEELARFIVHRFDGLVFEFAESLDVDACERQTVLLADAVLMLAGAGTRASGTRAAARRPSGRATRASAAGRS